MQRLEEGSCMSENTILLLLSAVLLVYLVYAMLRPEKF
jgi:K+-transporting ATPase KdpF subunit